MSNRITSLPNYINGKLYKRWKSVDYLLDEPSLLASKTSKKGLDTELIISKKGRKRELYTPTYKITDTEGIDFVKKTFISERIDGLTHGRMYTKAKYKFLAPLISSAQWITDGIVPKFVKLKINSKLPEAIVHIPDEILPSGAIRKGKGVKAVEVIAKDFTADIRSLPRQIEITDVDGITYKISSQNHNGHFVYSSLFGLNADKELGKQLRVIV